MCIPLNKKNNYPSLKLFHKSAQVSSIEQESSISCYTRNFSNIEKALGEAFRVLKPGGKIYCLEFSKAENETISNVYNFYSSIINKIQLVQNKVVMIITKNEQYNFFVARTFVSWTK